MRRRGPLRQNNPAVCRCTVAVMRIEPGSAVPWRTSQTAASGASNGRIALTQRSPREGPQSAPNPTFITGLRPIALNERMSGLKPIKINDLSSF